MTAAGVKDLQAALPKCKISPPATPQVKAINESQADAVAAIETLGGIVTFDDTIPGKPVVHADFFGTKVTDAGLEHLKGLTNLEILSLDDNKVTDAGLEHLKGLTNLRSVYLGGTTVTDAGVKDLQAVLPKCGIFKPPVSLGTR